MPLVDDLRNLGNKFLSFSGQKRLEHLLVIENFDQAKVYLLGAIDGAWEAGKTSEEEARNAYLTLDIDPDNAARLRGDDRSKYRQ